MNKFSFFGKKYDFSYFFFLDKHREPDIADELYKIEDINKEKIIILNRIIELMSSLEVTIAMMYNYEKLKSEHCSTMEKYDLYVIRTNDFNLIVKFNLSIFDKISKIDMEFVDYKKIKQFKIKSITEFENVLEEIFNKIAESK